MDFHTAVYNLNWGAVLVAALSTFLIGGIWYRIFEKAWLSANRVTREDLKGRSMGLVFGFAFLFSLLMAINLALFIGEEGVTHGAITGFHVGFGFIFFALGIISLFENRSFKYVLINGGYMIVAFMVMGAIIGAWH
ncbi:MAG TPA: DUF1761 domain-containing protein [Lentimicrobium sp.]|nr:DUF1761 domain-containing protein [Lentimicrobium sp.]